jgi:PAS domain S-box-containing protein
MYYRRPDGGLTVLEVNASRITTHDGRQLGVCTFQDVTEEYERRRALGEAAERVQLALDAGAIVGTWVWDVQADAMTADDLFARTFGLDPERCRTGFPAAEPMVSVHPADRASVEAAVGEALARGGAYRCQYRLRQHDGRFRWVEASGWAELDAHGRARRFPGVLLDITAWKHAEEARALLMREVDHRSRNALAMVQSVLRLTDASDAARYRDEVVGRVDAMARAQGSLSRTNWEGAALEDVVREEVTALALAERFHIAGLGVTLAAEQVQPLNLMIHELVTNALKYGALSATDGRVEIRWRLKEDRYVELKWAEHGGPLVTPPQKRGFGSRLITRLATQLGGAAHMDWRPGGLVATLTLRMDEEATA